MTQIKVHLREAGSLTEDDVEQLPTYPSRERFAQGPVVVIECAEEIPCDPCEQACRQGAIVVGKPISTLPTLDPDLCSGCGLCIPACPGQAIFVVDMTFGVDQALIQLPFEYLPLPEVGAVVDAMDRDGRVVGEAEVARVLGPRSYDHTAVVSIVVSRDLANVVRMIRIRRGTEEWMSR